MGAAGADRDMHEQEGSSLVQTIDSELTHAAESAFATMTSTRSRYIGFKSCNMVGINSDTVG
jgi:hypothetical protein